jgi:hypothetical protein
LNLNVNDGDYNTALGFDAARFLTNGSTAVTDVRECTYLGAATRGSAATGVENETAVGYLAVGQGADTVTLGNADVTDIYAAQDSGATIHCGGITATNEVLRENLLTNSGFDVWSQSTLEVAATFSDDDCADDSTSNWTDVGAGSALTFDTDHYELTRNASDARSFDTITALTVGKLYKLSIDVKDGTASSQTISFGCSTADVQPAGEESIAATTTSSFVTHTKVFEADAAFTRLYLWVNANLGGNNVEVKDISLTEVTPGCVAANALAMDGWGKSTSLDVFRQHNDGGTLTHDGSFYALKTTTASTGQYVAWHSYPTSISDQKIFIQRFAGRTMTLGAWVKTSTASHASLRLYDGTGTSSGFHTGGGGWEWLEVTRTISATPTYFWCFLDFAITATDAYISQPMLVFGTAIGSGNYSRPSGEIVNVEKNITIQSNVSPLAADDKILNLEALSDGKIPKGAKAIRMMSQIKNSAAASDQGIRWGADASNAQPLDVFSTPYVSNVYTQANGVVACDSNGDIYQEVTEADATLNSLYQYVRAVHLR